MISLLLCVCGLTSLPLNFDIYQFDNSYIEVWYQIPIDQIFSPQELIYTVGDSIFRKYSYRLDIYSTTRQDSAYIEGDKGTYINVRKHDKYFIDYFPVYLYPGEFTYRFAITAGTYTALYDGHVFLPSDSIMFYGSDLILAKGNRKGFFERQGFSWTPVIDRAFTKWDTLFSYIELYGLVPDSLYYKVSYAICDTLNRRILYRERECLKYADDQADTCTFLLQKLAEGVYTMTVTVNDPARPESMTAAREFRIIAQYDIIADMEFYDDIQYLVDPSEYDRYLRLSYTERKTYLKNFWESHNYWQYEKRIKEADDKFSTRLLAGRNSERGRFYIKNGPPDDVESMPMKEWARPLEVWHYFAHGYHVVFSDIKSNGNPMLVKILKPGEEIGEEDWVFDIAPGTFEEGEAEMIKEQLESEP